VFARKFWNRIHFNSVEEVDEKLQWFNRSSEQYTRYKKPDIEKQHDEDFIPRVYLIRQVKEKKDQTKTAYIDVLNEDVLLPESFINYFVLAEWNLKTQQLIIYFERNQTPEVIKKVPFKINLRSKSRCSHFI